MKVQGAAMSLLGKRFVVILVGMDVVESPGEADLAIAMAETSLGSVPVVLMAQKDDGTPRYYGDGDLVELLRGVPLERMPWQEYRIG